MSLSKIKAALFTAAVLLSSTASAHLITFGWTDNGNGTVTLWGEHWHGAQAGAYSDNGGISIFDNAVTPNLLYTVQWQGYVNNQNRDTMLSNGTLTGFQAGFNNDFSYENNWFYTDALVIGDGTYNFFTGTECCVDTMDDMATVTLSGITSVPVGTGPGSAVPEPSSIILFGLGLLGLGFARSRKA